jgi:hypothetical protein
MQMVLKEGLRRPSDEVLSVLRECDHPSVVSFLEVPRRESPAFLVMEVFEENGSLENLFCRLFSGTDLGFGSRLGLHARRSALVLLFCFFIRGLFFKVP